MSPIPTPVRDFNEKIIVVEEVPPPQDEEDVEKRKEAAKLRAASLSKAASASSTNVWKLISPTGSKSLKVQANDSSSEAEEEK